MNNSSKIQISAAALEVADEKAPVLYFGDFAKNLYHAAEDGFDAMEIHLRDPLMYDSDTLNEACERSGMKISGIATGLSNAVDGLSLIDDDYDGRTAAVTRLKSFVDLACDINAAVLVGRMKSHIRDFSKQGQYESLLADSMLRAGEYAERKGVDIMLEAINRYESNYRYTIADIAALITEYDIPSTRILMDTFHMNIEEADLCQAVEKNFSLLGYFHFADSNRLYPGGGHTDLEAVYQTLCNLGYEGYIGIECLPIPDGDTAAKKAISYMKSLPFIFARK
jgi:sugar phosphate isomerase/epimerase